MASLKSKGTHSEEDKNIVYARIVWQNSGPREIAFCFIICGKPGCPKRGPVKTEVSSSPVLRPSVL